MGDRIQKFFYFLQQNDFDGSITWFENEFHVNVSIKGGKIISYNQNFRLEISLADTIKDLKIVGII